MIFLGEYENDSLLLIPVQPNLGFSAGQFI